MYDEFCSALPLFFRPRENFGGNDQTDCRKGGKVRGGADFGLQALRHFRRETPKMPPSRAHILGCRLGRCFCDPEVSSFRTAIQTLSSSKWQLCPHAGRAPYLAQGGKIWKKRPYVGGLRSPLAIPESDQPVKPFRTVGRYSKNDITLLKFATNQHRQAKSGSWKGSLSRPEPLTP